MAITAVGKMASSLQEILGGVSIWRIRGDDASNVSCKYVDNLVPRQAGKIGSLHRGLLEDLYRFVPKGPGIKRLGHESVYLQLDGPLNDLRSRGRCDH